MNATCFESTASTEKSLSVRDYRFLWMLIDEDLFLPSGRIAFEPLANGSQWDYENNWPIVDLQPIDYRFLWMLVEDLFERFNEHLVPSKIQNNRKGDLTRLRLVISGYHRLAFQFTCGGELCIFHDTIKEYGNSGVSQSCTSRLGLGQSAIFRRQTPFQRRGRTRKTVTGIARLQLEQNIATNGSAQYDEFQSTAL
ncbi:hypothetical protein FAGAP_2533 [Fusarium agapanthi]|uniref:Uncharacterized protein n=1 Tax=Fusarium agapanthi TaxID=1803897 RepID=A0A9P5BFL7_9HYPO|nr:hypothetical protein FAGAP_2533 [Fusarium agapanthi]